jgi:hypothetical protein
MNALELGLVFNTTKEEQEKGIARRQLGNGKYVEIRAIVGKELCKREDISTFLICFLLLQHSNKRKGYSFETTYYQIGKMFEGTGGSQYKEIEKSLARLQENSVETNFWWDNGSGKRVIRAKFHWISSQFDEEKGFVRINLDEEIAKNMEKGYIKFLEEKGLKEILKIKSYFAKTLILLFIKRFSESGYIPEYKVNTILEYLGVKEKYDNYKMFIKRQAIKRTIIPAVQEAADFLGYSITYNDTGEKDGNGNPIPDPKGEEKFRFFKKQEGLFAETTKNISGENVLTAEERNMLEKKQKEILGKIEKTNKNL